MSENIKNEIIQQCISISHKFDLQSILLSPFTGQINGEDTLLFVLLYYYTNDESFDLKVNYDIWMADYPRDRKRFMDMLIDLFVYKEKLNQKRLEMIYPIVGDDLKNKIENILYHRIDLLTEWSKKKLEEMFRIKL
jgi:hypothetical protein